MILDLEMPDNLHPDTKRLVQDFAKVLAEKLHRSEKKYGYSNGWLATDWQEECRQHLFKHVGKGDPLDVAAYCAFMWRHGWATSTGSTPTKWQQYPENLPPSSGHYAVMVRGDSERDGPHVFYDFDDYQTFATYSDGAQSFKGQHDEEDETIFAWFGPLEVPPLDVSDAR